MPLTRIRELYVVELSEIYESEQEILRQLPLMAALTGNAVLREAFDSHYRATHRHVDRLSELFDHLDERRRHTPAAGIHGLVEEARLRQSFLDRGDLLDLALVDAGRRIEHYEMAAYHAALTYANRLGDSLGLELLTETLEDERQMDEQLEVFLGMPLAPAPRVSAA
jgi:ferritin-like metal-binding protein YciE